MKKKQSIQSVIKQARKHPYQQTTSNSASSIPQNVLAIPHSSSNNKVAELVSKILFI